MFRYVDSVLLGLIGMIGAVDAAGCYGIGSVVGSSLVITVIVGAVVIGGLLRVRFSAAEDRAVDGSREEQRGVLAASIALVMLALPQARFAGVAGAAAVRAIAGLRPARHWLLPRCFWDRLQAWHRCAPTLQREE